MVDVIRTLGGVFERILGNSLDGPFQVDRRAFARLKLLADRKWKTCGDAPDSVTDTRGKRVRSGIRR